MNLETELMKTIFKQNGKTLQKLILPACTGLCFHSIHSIVNNCVELTEVNLSETTLAGDSLNLFAHSITPKVRTNNEINMTLMPKQSFRPMLPIFNNKWQSDFPIEEKILGPNQGSWPS